VSAIRQATVLVLERNAAVQELIDQALRESGHRVLSTGDSLEALELVRRVRIDVLVVGDLVGNQTEALVSELRSSQPSLEVIETGGRDNGPFSLDDLVGGVAASVR
jgi:CheY-like chemotaxis protein